MFSRCNGENDEDKREEQQDDDDPYVYDEELPRTDSEVYRVTSTGLQLTSEASIHEEEAGTSSGWNFNRNRVAGIRDDNDRAPPIFALCSPIGNTPSRTDFWF